MRKGIILMKIRNFCFFSLQITFQERKYTNTHKQTARTEGSVCMNSECWHRKCCVHFELSDARAYSAVLQMEVFREVTMCRWASTSRSFELWQRDLLLCQTGQSSPTIQPDCSRLHTCSKKIILKLLHVWVVLFHCHTQSGITFSLNIYSQENGKPHTSKLYAREFCIVKISEVIRSKCTSLKCHWSFTHTDNQNVNLQKVKVKFTLQQAMKAQRCIALLFL
jgi:hypothetical protein